MLVYLNNESVILDEFTSAYIECALWSSTDESREDGGDPLDENYSEDDLSPECLAKMIADCKAFQEENAEDLEAVNDNLSSGELGHCFWLSRNRHGAGFIDYKGEAIDRLLEAAHAYGEVYLYVGDDGQIYSN
jgi:hypothetical protein